MIVLMMMISSSQSVKFSRHNKAHHKSHLKKHNKLPSVFNAIRDEHRFAQKHSSKKLNHLKKKVSGLNEFRFKENLHV